MSIELAAEYNTTPTEWNVWLPCWKDLPESLHYHIINLIDSIDIRRHFNLQPRKLRITEPYITHFSDHVNLKNTGYSARFNIYSNTLHILSYFVVEDDDDSIIDNVYSHKIYNNIKFDRIADSNTYFTNMYKTHTELETRYFVFSKTSIYVQKPLKTNVVISRGPIQNIFL